MLNFGGVFHLLSEVDNLSSFVQNPEKSPLLGVIFMFLVPLKEGHVASEQIAIENPIIFEWYSPI